MTRAVAAEIGGQRTSIRLSPEHNIQGIEETDPADVEATYQHLAREIAPLGLGFVDILHSDPGNELVQGIRRTVGAPLVVNRGFGAVTDREEAAGLVADGVAEAVRVRQPHPDADERQIEDDQHQIADPHAGDQAPEEIRVARHHLRAGLNVVNGHGAHHQRHHGIGRNAQNQQRNEGCLRASKIGRASCRERV